MRILIYPSYADLSRLKSGSKQLRGSYTRANSFASGIKFFLVLFFIVGAFTLLFRVNFVSAQSCSSTTPGKSSIFQIDTTSNSADLHVVPPADDVTSYSVVYGFSSGDEKFGATFSSSKSTSALTFSINGLSSGTTYWFKIRAVNNCTSGEWSEWKSGTTKGSGLVGTSSATLPQAGSAPLLPFLIGFSLFLIAFPFVLMI